ncbi:MAG: hypothetical protein ACXV3C_00425 [Actinomycetes bacterium]
MLLVPRQLQRAGMTGSVPYYGGRLSPEQAYAASHPSAPPPRFASPALGGRGAVGESRPRRATAVPADSAPKDRPDTISALQQLLDDQVITAAEYEELRARVPQ